MKKTIDFKQKRVTYQSWGKKTMDRPVLMLVHGFPEDGHIFQYQYEFLQSKFAVLIPDLPGSGESDYNESLTSVSDFGELIAAILDAEQLTKCVVVGHSMGGYIALAFAGKYPHRIAGLGLMHSTTYADNPDKKMNRLKAIDFMERCGGYRFIKTMIPDLFSQSFKESHWQFINQLIENGTRFKTRALQQYYQIMHDREDSTALLQGIKVPVLFIIGQEDKAAPMADMLKQATYPDTAQVLMLPGVVHMGFLEARGMVNTALEQFMSLETLTEDPF